MGPLTIEDEKRKRRTEVSYDKELTEIGRMMEDNSKI